MAEVLEKGIFFLAHAHKDFFPAKAVAELHRRGFLSSLFMERQEWESRGYRDQQRRRLARENHITNQMGNGGICITTKNVSFGMISGVRVTYFQRHSNCWIDTRTKSRRKVE